MTEVVLFASVLLSGLLAGNELSTLVVSPPAVRRLPLRDQVEAERALTYRLARIMPFAMTGTLAVAVIATVLLIGESGFIWALIATVALAAMLAITLIANVPLNKQTEAFSADGDARQWNAIRARWERLHTVRVILDIVAFALLAAALAAIN